MRTIILIILLSTAKLLSVQVLDKTETTFNYKVGKNEIVTFSVESNKSAVKDSIDIEAIEFKKDNSSKVIFGGVEGNLVSVTGLSMMKSYHLNVYDATSKKYIKSQNVKTLALKPKDNGKNIVFAKGNDTTIAVKFNRGETMNYMIIMAKDKEPELPINGVSYGVDSKYLSSQSRLGEYSSVIYRGKYDGKIINANVSDYAKYYFRIVSYNGEGEHSHYNTIEDNNSVRFAFPGLKAPVAKKVEKYEPDYFYAHWDKLGEGVQYKLWVARDPEFTLLLENYVGADFGEFNEIPVEVPDMQAIYYYRVTAFDNSGESNFSNTIEVDMSKSKLPSKPKN